MAYCLTTLGEVALEMQAYGAARRHFESAYSLRQEFRDPEGMALVLAYLGDTAIQQKSLSEALRCYDESRALYQQINDPGGLARTLCGLSRAQVLLGDYPAASQNLRKALQIALTIHYIPVLLQLLVGAAEVCYVFQNQATALEILALVGNHTVSDHASRMAIQQVLARNHIAELPAAIPGHDLQDTGPLLQMAARIQWTLQEIEEGQPGLPELASPHRPAAIPPLLDALSQRELEVLSYIAVGLQNREIADRLVVSLNTVKTHINNIYSKLGVTNRVQAVTHARDMGLLQPPNHPEG